MQFSKKALGLGLPLLQRSLQHLFESSIAHNQAFASDTHSSVSKVVS